MPRDTSPLYLDIAAKLEFAVQQRHAMVVALNSKNQAASALTPLSEFATMIRNIEGGTPGEVAALADTATLLLTTSSTNLAVIDSTESL